MIKAVFFDIDGTFLDSRGEILASTLRGVEALHQQGIKCFISSGRGPSSAEDLLKGTPFDGYVLYNGQLCFSHETGIYEHYFSVETLEALGRYTEKEQRHIIFGGRERYYGSKSLQWGQVKWLKKVHNLLPIKVTVPKLEANLQKIRRIIRPKEEQVKTPREIFSEPMYQCVLLSSPSEQGALETQFPDCKFTRSNPYAVDIIPKGGSKLVGITKVLDHYGLSLSDAMAFGDSWNDLEMLEGVGIGVAMGNGEEDVKRIADYVAESNDDDGIYKALQHFELVR